MELQRQWMTSFDVVHDMQYVLVNAVVDLDRFFDSPYRVQQQILFLRCAAEGWSECLEWLLRQWTFNGKAPLHEDVRYDHLIARGSTMNLVSHSFSLLSIRSSSSRQEGDKQEYNSIDELACCLAIAGSHLFIFDLLSRHHRWTRYNTLRVSCVAAAVGRVDIIEKHLTCFASTSVPCDRSSMFEKYLWLAHVATSAIRGGSVAVVERLFRFNDCNQVYIDPCYIAVKYERIQVLRMLRSLPQPYRIHEKCFRIASKRGRLDFLQYMYKQEPPTLFSADVLLFAKENDYQDILAWLDSLPQRKYVRYTGIGSYWAKRGCVEALRWIRQYYPTDVYYEQIHAIAIKRGYLSVLKWLLLECHFDQENDDDDDDSHHEVDWQEHACAKAAKLGHLSILRWLRTEYHRPYRWDERTCAMAVVGGQVDVLRWLRLECVPPCPWDEQACLVAIRANRLDLLMLLRSFVPPCPWSVESMLEALQCKRDDIVKWMRAQTPPCPWDERVCQWVADHKDTNLLRWMRSSLPSCPWTEACEQQVRECLGYTEYV